jgi:hypothetical protein
VITYKGFNADMSCRGFKFEIGGEYKHSGNAVACESGFHACEYPLDVFNYYPPSSSVYAEVEQSGQLSRHSGDSKVASSVIAVRAAISIAGLVKAAIDYTVSRSTPENGSSATGYQGAASATGDQGAASATGYQGAASATGVRGAASATGYAGKVRGAKGNALFLVQRDVNDRILHVWAGIAGRDDIEPDTWYTLKGGKPVKVE